MASKLVSKRGAVIRFLITSIRQHGDAMAVPLRQLLFPDGVPPDLTLEMVLQAMADAAEREYGVLATADIELSKELSDDLGFREVRDDSTDDLRTTVQRGRGGMVAGFGPSVLAKVGLAGEMPEDAAELAQVARAAADLVETAELGAPSLPIDRAAVASQLRESAARADRAHIDVIREEREAQDVRSRRDDADALARRVYVGFADAFAGLAIAVGRGDVASRVRTTARRRAGEPEQEDLAVTDPVDGDPTDPVT